MLVGLAVILTSLSAWRVANGEKSWAATLGTREAILSRYPPAEADPPARELERLTTSIGIDVAPRLGEGRARPSREEARAHATVKPALGDYLTAQLGRAERGPEAPPAKVQAFLEARAGAIEAVRAHLEGGRVPRWEVHLERGVEAPIPNLLGHIDLQKLLVTDALVRLRDGDRGTALRDLEAGWTLMLSLADSPHLICQLIALSDARMVAGVLRQIEDAPPVWQLRLREQDFRGSFITALKYEGWIWTQWPDAPLWGGGLRGLGQGLLHRVGRPYFDLCMADVSDQFRERLENLEDVQALCDYDLAAYEANLDLDVPRWNVIGKITVPNIAGSVDRLARLELDVELTILVMDLEAARDAQGEWPAILPDGGASVACPRDRWTYAPAADGSATVALERQIDWGPGVRGAMLPTRFRLAASG